MKRLNRIFSELVAAAVFPCRRCGKIFLNKKTMWNHMGICGKDPQFPCEACGKRFKYKHHLTKHLQSSKHKLSNNMPDTIDYVDSKDWFYQ